MYGKVYPFIYAILGSLGCLFVLTSPLAALDETSILDIGRDETSILDICGLSKSRGWMTSGPLALAWATDSNLHFRQAASVTFVC